MKRTIRSVTSGIIVLLLVSQVYAQEESYKIGAIFALSGPASWMGEPQQNTVKMIEEQVNAEGGINGRRLEIHVENTLGQELKAVTAIYRLIAKYNVSAIIGPSRSGSSLAAVPVAEEQKICMISCAPAEAIVDPVRQWVYKVAPDDADAARKIYETLHTINLDRVAIISCTTGFGKAGRYHLKRLAHEMGISIIADKTYDSDDTDMTSQLKKLNRKNPQVIINWSIIPAQINVITASRQMGLKTPFFLSHGFGHIKYAHAAGQEADGVMLPGGRLLVADDLPKDHPQRKMLRTYRREYEAKFRMPVSIYGGYAFDAANLIIAALREVGPERSKIRDYIEQQKNFTGVSGVYNFSPDDHGGLDHRAFAMLTLKKGSFFLLQQQEVPLE